MLSNLRKKVKRYKSRINELESIKDRKLTVDEKKELKELKRDYTKAQGKLRIQQAKKFVKSTVSFIIGVFTAVVAVVSTLFSALGVAIINIVLIVAILLSVVSSLIGSGVFDNLGGYDIVPPERGVAGAKYVFNVADMNSLESTYSKNIYLLAWLWTNVKEMSGDAITIPITNALGETVYEYGGNFFKPYTVDYENNLISEYACGFPNGVKDDAGVMQASNEICQGLYQCNSKDFNTDALNYWSKFGYTSLKEVTDAAWGSIPHNRVLKAPDGADEYIYSYWDSAKNTGDYSATVYDAAYQVMYSGYINGANKRALTGNAGGHSYSEYYNQACKVYGISASDVNVQNWFYNALAYVFHAGSMSGSFITDEYKDAALNAAFDYLGYVYTNYYKDASWASYNIDKFANWGSPGGASNKVMFENAFSYTVAAQGSGVFGTGCEPFGMSTETYMSNINGEKVLTNNVAYLWYNTLDGERKENADIFRRGYMYDTTIITDKYPGSQGAYAFLAGWASALGGTSRLNYVFKQLEIDWTVNDLGYICYNGGKGIAITTTGVNPKVVVKEFDVNKASYWQEDWFEIIDESEWAYPIDYGSLGDAAHITSLFGERDYNNNEFHCGLDMSYLNAATTDYKALPLYAMHDGKIINMTNNHPQCGNYIMYECTWKVFDSNTGEWKYKTGRFLYMHMAAFGDNLSVGQEIKQGDILGYMGGTGNVAVHLHMQLSTTGVDKAASDSAIRNIATELPFVTWWNNYDNYVASGTDGRLKGAPIKLGFSNSDGTDADTATNSDEHP